MDNIIEKSKYCLNCKVKPCSNKGCPMQNDIPEFIQKIKEENYKEAYKIISKTSVLPGVCGRICPHEKQCQGSCVRGIKGEPVSIGELEAFIFDKAMEEEVSLKKVWQEEKEEVKENSQEKEMENTDVHKFGNNKELSSKKVAIVGGGPAGLTAGAFLAKERNSSYNL